MAEAPKARIARLRRQLAIPRHLYLEAVKRQEDRAGAKLRDPAYDAELREAYRKIHERLSDEGGSDPKNQSNLPKVRDPEPALFDGEEEIQKDDKLIAAYLADNPTEKRKPMARGYTHDELLEYWENSSDGQRYFDWLEQQIAEAVERVSRELMGEQAIS